MKPFLFAAVFGLLMVGGAAQAKQVCQTEDVPGAPSVRSCYDDGSDDGARAAPSSGGGNNTQPADQSRQRALKRQRDIEWSTDEAADYIKRGDWDNAIRSFEEALDKDPDNEDLAKQLADARTAKANAAAAKARAAPVASALPKPTAKPPPNQDASVVDTRGVPKAGADLIARVPALANSVAADRIRKGYQAVIAHDWPVALTWWQEALQRDPNNAALKRSVDLAQWMATREAVKVTSPAPFAAAIDAATKGDDLRATALLLNLKAASPALTEQADILLAAIRNRVPPQTPKAKANDVEVLMLDFYTDPMAGTALAVLAHGDAKGADQIFAKIDATLAGKGK